MVRPENIRPYEEGDIDKIIPRDMDLRLTGPDYKERIRKNAERSETITVQKDGEILAITGLVIIHPGMAEIWSFTGKAIDKYKILFAQASIMVVDFWIRKYNLHRLQANTHVEHATSIKWLEWLGFEREGLMRKFGASAENFYLYARIR